MWRIFTHRLQLRVPPGDILDRTFETRAEAEAYAEGIFLLHPDKEWRDIVKVVEAKTE